MTEQTRKSRKWPIIVAVVFVAIGCAAWICQLTMGLLVGSGILAGTARSRSADS